MAATTTKLYTLVFVLKEEEVLLGLKKRGFAEGRWNGFGGKVEIGETIEDAAKRELKEESGLTVSGNMDHVGILTFEFVDNPILMEVHVFRTCTFDGLLMETEEMLPRWYTHESIPFDSMWPDDKLWYPMMLSGKYFNGYFKFEGMDNLLQYTIEEVS